MKTLKKIVVWGGGAFLLTLSVVLGVCLVTLPGKANINAATETINGVQYEVYDLVGDNAAIWSKIRSTHTASFKKNLCYVLQNDWTVVSPGGNPDIYAAALMIDLNGYTIYGSPTLLANTVEITDSSPARTGTWTHKPDATTQDIIYWQEANQPYTCQSITISGGTLKEVSFRFAQNNAELIIHGGNYTADTRGRLWTNNAGSYTHKVTFDPWVTPTYTNGEVTSFNTPDYLALSTSSDELVGMEDCRELSGSNLATVSFAADQTYYLWGRSATGQYRYQYSFCEHGTWTKYGSRQTVNGIDWLVIHLDGTHEENVAKINIVPNDAYVKYVLQTNWTRTANVALRGKYIIFDLHGYTTDVSGYYAINFPSDGTVVEFTDSTPEGNGVISGYSNNGGAFNSIKGMLILSGGTVTPIGSSVNMFVMTGGTLAPQTIHDFWFSGEPANRFYADYVQSYVYSKRTGYRTEENTTGASFAMYGSTNDYVSGAYNYEFSQLTENLGPGDCILEKMTNPNQPNYLLYRANPTAAYQVIATL